MCRSLLYARTLSSGQPGWSAAERGAARADEWPVYIGRNGNGNGNSSLSNRSHCLCHGDLGNLECLHLIQQATGMLDEAQLHRATRLVLEDISTRGPRSGVPASADHPGFMTGLAGIGWALLRIAHPQRVPSVLNLEGAASGQRLNRQPT